MEINRDSLSKILCTNNVKPDKDYGQNFLVEPEIAKRIVNSLDFKNEDKVIEVGPGLGSLTHFLVEATKDLTAVEIDERMANYIKDTYKDNNINVITNDIRKIDVSQYTKIISNLPYNITTELLQYFLINGVSAKKMVFMIQSETFAHFYDVSGKEYGPTSVLVHLLGNIEKLFTVKAGCFYPAPKCNSTVFSIDLDTRVNRNNAISAFKLAKQLFINRRKTIQNNLTTYLGNKEEALAICNKLCINPLLRPEQISPNLYLKMLSECNKHR